MKCKVCGYEYSDDKLICPMCGAEREDRFVRNNSEMTWNTKDFPKPVQEAQAVNIHWSAPDASEGYVSVANNEQKKPEMFNTFQAKNEEFQKLLDQEFERLKNIQKETERLNIKSSYDSLFEPKVAAVVDNPVPQFVRPANEEKKENITEAKKETSGIGRRFDADEEKDNNRISEPEPMRWPHVGNLDKPIEKSNPVWPNSAPKRRSPAEIYAAMMAAEEFEESKKEIGPKPMDNDAFDQMIMEGTKDISEVPDASPLNLESEPMAPDAKNLNAFDINVLEYSIRQIEEEEKHAQLESEERRKKLEAMAAARDAYFKCLDETDNGRHSRGFGFRKEKAEEPPVVQEYTDKVVSKIEIPIETPVVIKPVPASGYYSVEPVDVSSETVVAAPISFGLPSKNNEEKSSDAEKNDPVRFVEEIIDPMTEDRDHTTQFDKDEFRTAQKKIEAEFLRIQSAEESESNPSSIEDATPIFMDEKTAAVQEKQAEETIEPAKEPENSGKFGLDEKTFEDFDKMFAEISQKIEVQTETNDSKEERISEKELFAMDLKEDIPEETKIIPPFEIPEFNWSSEEPKEEPSFEPLELNWSLDKPEEHSLETSEDDQPAEEAEVISASETIESVRPEAETVSIEEPVKETNTEWLSLDSLEASVAEMAATHNEKGDLSLDESGNVVVELKNNEIQIDEFESAFAEYYEDVDDTIDTKDVQAALADLEARENDELDDEDDEFDDDVKEYEYADDDDEDDEQPAKRGLLLRFLFLIILIIAIIQGVVFALSKVAPDAGFVQTLVAIAESIQAAIDNAAGTAVEKIMNIF